MVFAMSNRTLAQATLPWRPTTRMKVESTEKNATSKRTVVLCGCIRFVASCGCVDLFWRESLYPLPSVLLVDFFRYVVYTYQRLQRFMSADAVENIHMDSERANVVMLNASFWTNQWRVLLVHVCSNRKWWPFELCVSCIKRYSSLFVVVTTSIITTVR